MTECVKKYFKFMRITTFSFACFFNPARKYVLFSEVTPVSIAVASHNHSVADVWSFK